MELRGCDRHATHERTMNTSITSSNHFFRPFLQTIAVLALSTGLAASQAMDVDGVRFDDRIKVGNASLQLNGAGTRFAAGGFVRAYATALYLPEKIKREADIKNVTQTKRIQLVMLREVNANDLGRAMMKALNANLTPAERARHSDGIVQLGGIFGVVPSMKKGETITVDSIPGNGVLVYVNNKRVGETIRDVAFFDAMAQIWIGQNPVDQNLKLALLGQAPAKDEFAERVARY
jgi:Chalcone isomerase-like